jgi:hypothetical protein
MVGTVEDIRVWRLRAEELRVLADTMEDAAARLGVLHAARNYEQMAANAEARLKADPVVLELRRELTTGQDAILQFPGE